MKNQLVIKENDLIKIEVQQEIQRLDIMETKKLNLIEMKRLNLMEMKKFDVKEIKKLDELINSEVYLAIKNLDVGVNQMKMNVIILNIMKYIQVMMEIELIKNEVDLEIMKLDIMVMKKLDVMVICYEQY
ncbi:MAG: hypothetical protein EZS28_000345 [Streblomastix strix]|uniref:Uncharacterized protein n=1 Tax=Streblomastix strix TaxID=222440 RepID=A0A5J4XA99_9EUKA|nr:MAG: hypothetical protein EZS28_000345 [Streblomastix strix]